MKKLELFDFERDIIKPPDDLAASEWANNNVILLPSDSREPGEYRYQRTPYARDIMDLYQHPSIHHLVLKWATQTSKTRILYNLLDYVVDVDPYTTMLMYDTDERGKEISRSRVQTGFKAIESIRKKIPTNTSKYQLSEMHFPGMVLYIVGAHSPGQIAQKPCRNIFRDEINKFPLMIPGHGDPMELSEERFKSFMDIHKIVDVSSPTDDQGNITKQEAKCQVILGYYVPCPHCKRLQMFEFKGLKFDTREDLSENETVELSKKLKQLPKKDRISLAKKNSHYRCKFCAGIIDDEHKDWMLRAENGAGWFDIEIKEPQPTKDPMLDLFEKFKNDGIELESIATRLSSFYSPWLKFSDITAKFLDAHLSTFKRFDKLRTFTNDWLGMEYKDSINVKTENNILALKSTIPPLVVPKNVVALSAGIDPSEKGFFFSVWGWAQDYTSYLIRYGFLLSEDHVKNMIFDDSYRVEGSERIMQVWRAGYDTGGGKYDDDQSMTDAAYRFISKHGGNTVYGVKGSPRDMTTKMTSSVINFLPGKLNKLPIPGRGLLLWTLDTDYYKDLIHSRMQIKAGDPGCVYLHSETGLDFAQHCVSEEKKRDSSGRYKWVQVRGKNHLFDTWVYASAMVDPICYGGIGVINRPSGNQQRKKVPNTEKEETISNFRINNRSTSNRKNTTRRRRW